MKEGLKEERPKKYGTIVFKENIQTIGTVDEFQSMFKAESRPKIMEESNT